MKNLRFGEKALVNKASGLKGRVVNNEYAAEAKLEALHRAHYPFNLKEVMEFVEKANKNIKVVELEGYGKVLANKKNGEPLYYYKVQRHWIKDAQAKDGGDVMGEYYTKLPVKPMGRMGSSPRATFAMDMHVTMRAMACVKGYPMAEYKHPLYAAKYIDGITITASPASVIYFAPQFHDEGREFAYYAPAIDKESGKLHPEFQAFDIWNETIFGDYRPAPDEVIAFQLWHRSVLAKYRD